MGTDGLPPLPGREGHVHRAAGYRRCREGPPGVGPLKLRIRAFPVFGKDGTNQGFVELVEDLSTQYQTELALRESERRFRTLAETAPMGIFEVDREGLNTYSNPAWTRMTGLSTHESMGLGWLQAIPAEERERVQASWAEAKAHQLPWQKEHRLLRRDDEERWVQASATPVRDAEGNLLRWVGTVVDLTLQKKAMQQLAESEERFRSLYEKSGVGITILARSGRFITANPAFCALVGYTLQELQARSVMDLTPPEDLERMASMLEQLDGGEGRYNYQKRFLHKDGKYRLGRRYRGLGAEQYQSARLRDRHHPGHHGEKGSRGPAGISRLQR